MLDWNEKFQDTKCNRDNISYYKSRHNVFVLIIFLCFISDLVGQCALLVLWSLAQLTLPGFGPQSISLRTSLATGEDVNKNKINVELAHRYFSQNTILDFYLATWCLCGTPNMVECHTWCSIKKLILAAEIYFWTSRIVPATF